MLVVEQVAMRCHPYTHGNCGDEDDEGDDLEDAVDEPEAAEREHADHDAAGWEEQAECHSGTDRVCGDFEFEVCWWCSSEAKASIFTALFVWVAAATVVVPSVVATWWATELCCCERC